MTSAQKTDENRRILCRCMDVTVEDIEALFDEGVSSMEYIKRVTGLSTGICQGRGCLMQVARMISERFGIPAEEIVLTTQRPPFIPVPMKAFLEVPTPENNTSKGGEDDN